MPALTRDQYDVLVVLLAWTLGFLPLFWQKLRGRRATLTWIQCVGIGLAVTPFVRMLLGIYLNIGALFTFTILEPATREAMWRSVGRNLLFDLVFPVAGLLMLANAVPGLPSRRAPRGSVRRMLSSNGLAPKRSWARDAHRGLALFFLIAIAYGIAYAAASLVSPQVAGGDESRYWIHITVPLILLVSGTAGITEEILFRGVMLTRLARIMPLGLAAAAQALFFGLIHAGYGTWTHVLGPMLFGLGMAWIARTLGILPAILLHAQVNVVFFAIDVIDVAPQALWLLAALAALNAWAAWRTRLDAVPILWRSLGTGARDAIAWARGRKGRARVDDENGETTG